MPSAQGFDWQVPGFRELRTLGSGAQGRVVLASAPEPRQPHDNLVAIKYLRPELLVDQRSLSALRTEARLLAQVTNPHVARLLDYVEDDDGAAIVMEAVNGRSLRAVLDERTAPLEPQGALTVLKGSLLGLAAAHSVGVVHRDFKPSNIMVDQNGSSKLIDFGVAGLSGSGSRSGTPAYMAPEQWEGAPATPATDIYSATCVFFECVTGRQPFLGGSTEALMAGHLLKPVPTEAVPEELRPLLNHGMTKDPGERLWNANDLLAELESIASATYGKDWEQLGVAFLGAAASVLAATFPLSVIGSATGVTGTAGATLGHVAGATKSGINGVVGRLSRHKIVTAAAGTIASVGVIWFMWPSAPSVGGVSTGEYRLSFAMPARLLDNTTAPPGDLASPWSRFTTTVAPARVRAGTRVRLTVRQESRAPWGLEYMSDGRLKCHDPHSERESPFHHAYSAALGDQTIPPAPKGRAWVWLYKAREGTRPGLPVTPGLRVLADKSTRPGKGEYRYSDCSWHFDNTDVLDFSIPRKLRMATGRYLVSAFDRPGTVALKATVKGKLISVPSSYAGARIEGGLPMVSILTD